MTVPYGRGHEAMLRSIYSSIRLSVCVLFSDSVPFTTLCLKKLHPKAGRHKFCYFPNTKKIRNIRFVGNFILNKSCEIYYDDITMTSFIGNK